MADNANVVAIGKPAVVSAGSLALSEEERSALSDEQLARAILARDFRPRVGEVRRIAQALLSALTAEKKTAEKKKASGKAAKPSKPKKTKAAGKGKTAGKAKDSGKNKKKKRAKKG